MRTYIPCRVPKITSEPIEPGGLWLHACQVPGCGWTFRSVKTCQEVGWHKRDHRDAVPPTRIDLDGGLQDVYCWPCGGHRRSFPTKREAKEWLDRHLVEEHGLVVCP